MGLTKRKWLYATKYWQLRRHGQNDFCGLRCVIRPLHKVLNWKVCQHSYLRFCSRNWTNYSLRFSYVQCVCWWVRTFMFMFQVERFYVRFSWVNTAQWENLKTNGQINTYSYDVFAFSRWRPPPSWILTNPILKLILLSLSEYSPTDKFEYDRPINTVVIM